MKILLIGCESDFTEAAAIIRQYREQFGHETRNRYHAVLFARGPTTYAVWGKPDRISVARHDKEPTT